MLFTDKYLFFIGLGSITPSYQHDMLTACSIDIYITNDHEDTMPGLQQESPCIFQCRLETIDSKQMTILQTKNLLDKDCNNTELCIACGRTRSEIVNWSEFNQSQKETVFAISNKRLLEKLGKI